MRTCWPGTAVALATLFVTCLLICTCDAHYTVESGAKFLYLVHSPFCIHDLSAFSSQRSEVISLTTDDVADSCPHAIQLKNATWQQARNKLYTDAFKMPIFNSFQYLIMVDGLIVLREAMDFGHNTGDPWRTFENYLLEWEPAVAFPSAPHTEHSPPADVHTEFNLQMGIVAYHKEAAPVLLPYWEFEYDSEVQSSIVQAVVAWSAFNEHVLQLNALEMIQPTIGFEIWQWSPRSVLWIASSLRRSDDFLKLPWEDVEAYEKSEPKRRQQGNQPYNITNAMGYFDECHLYFSTNYFWKLGQGSCWRGRSGLGSPNRFGTMFPPSDDTRCAGHREPWYNSLPEKLLLYLQEIFVSFLAIEAEKDGGPPPGKCQHVDMSPRVQISFPTAHASLTERAIRGFHAAAIGLPRWDPFSPSMFAIPDGAAGTITVNDAVQEQPVFVNTFSVLVSSRGWPPVSWYCLPSSAVGSREMKMGVEGIQAGATYAVHAHLWSSCQVQSLSESVWPRCQASSSPMCGPNPEVSATTIFDVIFSSEKPEAPRNIETDRIGNDVIRSRSSRTRKEFVYLVQNDVCTDLSHLLSERAEVVQLNWKEEPVNCPGAIYLPRSTLVQGRNRLFAEVANRFPTVDFTYYVIMDGDVTLQEVKDFGRNTGNPWLTFENYLLDWEPAVGIPHFSIADYDDGQEVQLNFNFDQIVVAYHREAAPLLLPYTEAFDNVSWWYCGSVQNALCAAVYNEHRIQFNAVRALSWANNLSPTYLRASNFLVPLTWIAQAILSLDALMTIPWFGVFQTAPASVWDRQRQAWVSKGEPARKGGRSYDLAKDSGPAPLDFCHEYFAGRALRRLCRRRRLARSASLHRRVLAHLGEIRRRLWAAAAGLAGHPGLLAKSARLDRKIARFSDVLTMLLEGGH